MFSFFFSFSGINPEDLQSMLTTQLESTFFLFFLQSSNYWISKTLWFRFCYQ